MKKTLAALFVATTLVACGNGSYTVKGTFEGVPDSTVVTLNVVEADAISTIDSAVVYNGKFSFKGNADTCRLAWAAYETAEDQGACQFFLEGGKITVTYNALSGEQSTNGTPNNDAFQKFYIETGILNEKAMELEDKLRITAAADGDGHDIVDELNSLQDEYRALVANSIMENPTLEFGYEQLFQSYDMFEPEELAEFIEALTPTFGFKAELMELSQMVSMELLTATGAPYLDFECEMLNQTTQDTDSKAALSSFVSANKLTLLDFWATWCTPCMNELPYMKAAYEKFASKGFQIVSVSVDEDINEWKGTVKEQGMTWPQMWNGEDIENSPAAMYAVRAIPSTFLIDADGTIIGRNLRGEELDAALEDYFK